MNKQYLGRGLTGGGLRALLDHIGTMRRFHERALADEEKERANRVYPNSWQRAWHESALSALKGVSEQLRSELWDDNWVGVSDWEIFEHETGVKGPAFDKQGNWVRPGQFPEDIVTDAEIAAANAAFDEETPRGSENLSSE